MKESESERIRIRTGDMCGIPCKVDETVSEMTDDWVKVHQIDFTRACNHGEEQSTAAILDRIILSLPIEAFATKICQSGVVGNVFDKMNPSDHIPAFSIGKNNCGPPPPLKFLTTLPPPQLS